MGFQTILIIIIISIQFRSTHRSHAGMQATYGIRRSLIGTVLGSWLVILAGCGGGSGGGSDAPPQSSPLSAAAQLGEKIFEDPSLSASGRLACATCHDPNHALAPALNEPVPIGGADLDVAGFRDAPSLRYIGLTPTFSFDNDG